MSEEASHSIQLPQHHTYDQTRVARVPYLLRPTIGYTQNLKVTQQSKPHTSILNG